MNASKYIGAMAWHGMGLGKTLTSLDYLRNHLARMRAGGATSPKALIIMPKSAHSTWQTECNKFTPDIWRDLILLPYSQIHKAFEICKFYDIRAIVFDEYHYLKNPETNRAKALSEMLVAIHESKGKFQGGKIIPLSGTPMPNGAHEWYTTWAMLSASDLAESAKRLIDPKRYNDWKQTFAKRKEISYEGYDPRQGKKVQKYGATYEGTDNEDMLAQLISPIVHFRKVEDCVDLPKKDSIPIDLNLADDKLLADANIAEPEAYMALLERLARAKCPYMIDWVRNFLATTDKQLVIFSPYLFALQAASEKFKKDVVLITGGQTGNERKENLELFQKGKKRIIALSYRAGSEALNLQNAHIGLYLGYPWTDGMLKQAMARIYRSGQTQSTLHYFLTSGHNDQRILSKVIAKGEATSDVENRILELQGTNSPIISLDTFI